MKNYTIENLLELIPQDAIRQCYVTDSPGYNACWDYHITPTGRHFLACCAEGAFPEYVRLYEYLPQKNVLELRFKLDDKIVVYPKAIRPSKLHTSMHSMPDGRIVMTTHTTASAPNHPCWMPEAFYSHMWEGFMGSNVLIYDPESGKVEDLGIPVPRESIYGSVYLKKEHAILFITYMRGHCYKMDLESRNVTDYGQLTEFGCYCVHEGPDGNIYFTSRSGDLWCYDSAVGKPEYTGIKIPEDQTVVPQGRNVLAYALNAPDGKMYINVHPHTCLYLFDTKTGKLSQVCCLRPPELKNIEYKGCSVFGLKFDSEGILWYTVTTGVRHMPLRLCSVDLRTDNPIPRDHGAIGTVDHAVFCIESVQIQDDILYLPDANGPYSPGVAAIDLSVIKKSYAAARVITQDPQCFHVDGVPRLTELYCGSIELTPENLLTADDESVRISGEYAKINHHVFMQGKTVFATKLWKKLGFTEGSQVKALEYDSNGEVKEWLECGKMATIRDGELLSISDCTYRQSESPEDIEDKFKNYILPAHPGRQYLAKASAYGNMADGTTIVGTKDGAVALVKDNKVFSLGMVCFSGGIHDIAVSPDGKLAVGVGGDSSDLGTIFTYSCEAGIELGGFLYYSVAGGLKCNDACSSSFEPCAVAFSKDGKRLAIGVRDNLGTVYEFSLE